MLNYKCFLRSYAESVLTASKSSFFVCPCCGSGNGKHKTGALQIDRAGQRWKCFSCGRAGDIFDLVGAVEGISGFANQKQRIEELYGAAAFRGNSPQSAATRGNSPQLESEADYTAFFASAHSHILETSYHRGVSIDTLNRFQIGYIEDYHAHNRGASGWNALIIPTGKSSYIIRNTDPVAPKENRYRKQGATHFLNIGILAQNTAPVFIVEGEFDCLAIEDCGGHAVALGSIANRGKFVAYCKEHPPECPLLISLDNDPAGQEAAEALRDELSALQIRCRIVNICGAHKDPAEAFEQEKEKFIETIKEACNLQ